MARSVLVTPELDTREVDVQLSDAPELLGGSAGGRLHVAFMEGGHTIAAVYSADVSEAADAEPNPLASMGRNESETQNPRFLSDPTRAICGPVLFVGQEGADLSDEEIDSIHKGIRAVENYREDNPEEFRLWRDAVVNLRRGV